MELPGERIELEGAWSPEEEQAVRKRRTYKEDMARPEAGENPFSQFLQDTTPAARIEETKTQPWDRFKSWFTTQQDYGSVGIDELGKIRDEQMQRDILPAPGGGVYQQTEADAQADAEFLASQRAERQFAFESMDPAETPMDYLAAIGGGLLGGALDPASLIGPEVKVGTTAWRMGNPVISKVLNYGVSGGAMNAALNATVQAEEGSVGLRDEIDWQSILLDAGAGFAFSLPFGYHAGRSARAEQIETDRLKTEVQNIIAAQPPAPGAAPMAPRAKVSRPASAWDDVLLSGVGDEAIQKAEQDLFGEVQGLRNLTPEQLGQLRERINAGKPEASEGLPETGVRSNAQPEKEPVREVHGGGQPESRAGASEADDLPQEFYDLADDHRQLEQDLEGVLAPETFDDIIDLKNLSAGAEKKRAGDMAAYPEGLSVNETIARASEVRDRLNDNLTSEQRATLKEYLDTEKKLYSFKAVPKEFAVKQSGELDVGNLPAIARMSREETDYLDFTPTGKLQNATIGKASVTYAVRPGEVEIISFRIPTEERRQGNGREAMMAFLERADDEGLAVRAYTTPLDRSMDPEGIVRFYEAMGFTATGRKIDRDGNLEMLRSGPPPEVAELRSLVGSGRVIPLRDYTDPAMAKEVKRAYYGAQPERTLDQLYEGGTLERRQAELEKWGKEAAEITGAKFKSPGLKKRATAEEKMVRKRYKSTRQLTDLVRAGFLVDHPDEAQRVINLLARHFQILDEGWNVTPENYFDKKISVRFTDGTIGEVQFWHPDLLEAKKTGHELYIQARSLPPGPEKAALEQAQRDLYSAVLEGLDPSWAATVGRGGSVPNVRENISRKSSSDSTLKPDSPTSLESTSSQSPPGSSTAQAKPSSRTAGRPSQSTKSMDPLLDPNGRWRKAKVLGTLEDGATVELSAGEAIDFLSRRRKSLQDLMDCINAA